MSAREVLEKAAASAQRQPDRGGAGRYQYVETQGWYLNTAISGQAARSAVIPVIRQQWIAADGSGRIITRPGSPWFPSAESRQAWHEAGRPALADLYGEQPVGPAIRAAVLRVIAALPGLRYDGTATDRAGRAGIGVSVESDLSGLPTRYTMFSVRAPGSCSTASRYSPPAPESSASRSRR